MYICTYIIYLHAEHFEPRLVDIALPCILTAVEGDWIRFPLVSITFCPAKPVSSHDASPLTFSLPYFNLFNNPLLSARPNYR